MNILNGLQVLSNKMNPHRGDTKNICQPTPLWEFKSAIRELAHLVGQVLIFECWVPVKWWFEDRVVWGGIIVASGVMRLEL